MSKSTLQRSFALWIHYFVFKLQQGFLHFLVPQGVDHRVQKGRQHSVENSHNPVHNLLGAWSQVNENEGNIETKDHNAVGGTGLEGSPSPLWGADLQDGTDDGHVGQHNKKKAAQGHHPNVDEDHHLHGGPVCTGQFEDRRYITDVMLDPVGSAERQTECRCGLGSRVQRTTEPRGCGQDGTRPPTHHAGVPERVTDGQVVVIGHDSVEEALGAAQEVEGVELGHTAGEGDSTAFWGHQGHQHFGHSDRGVLHVNEGQVG